MSLSLILDIAVAAGALAIPFVLLDRRYIHAPLRSACYYLMAVYLSAMFALVGLPDIRYIRFHPNINLIPFRYFFTDRSSGLNVLLFLPLGVLLPVLWQQFRSGVHAVLFGLGTSAFIELLQIFTLRATDINDLITNTLGTFLGWALGRALLLCFPKIRPCGQTKQVYLVCGITVAFMILLHPFLSDPVLSLLS